MVDLATVVFGVYMVGVLGIGVYASRFTTHDPLDYYIAGRTLGTVVLAFTLLATVLSSFTFFGVGAAASGSGFGLYAFLGLAAPFYTLLFIVVGAKLYRIGRDHDLLTPPEYVRARYESQLVSVVYVLVTGVFLIAFIATQIIGGGVALESLMGIPYLWAIVAMAVFMAVYIHIAGMRGVVWSDLVQGLILFLVLLGVFLFVNATIGGATVVERVTQDSPDIFTLRGPAGVWNPLFILTFMTFFAVGVTAYPQLIQRYFAARNVEILERSAILYGVVIIPIDILAVILGVWSLGFVQSPPNPDYVIALLIETLTNPLVFGVAMSAGIAAIMSTADSQLLTLSSMVSRDLYREYVDPDVTAEREVRITQAVLITAIVVALALAWLRPTGIFDLGALAVAGFATTAPAVFLGVYWRRGTATAAVVSMVLGAITMFAYFFEVIPGSYTFGMHYGFIGVLVSFAVFIVVSLVTETPSSSALSEYT